MGIRNRRIAYDPVTGLCDSLGKYCSSCPLSKEHYGGSNCAITKITQMLQEVNNDNHK